MATTNPGPATTGEVVEQIDRAADETMAAAILAADLHPEIAETVRVRLMAAREIIRAESARLREGLR